MPENHERNEILDILDIFEDLTFLKVLDIFEDSGHFWTFLNVLDILWLNIRNTIKRKKKKIKKRYEIVGMRS